MKLRDRKTDDLRSIDAEIAKLADLAARLTGCKAKLASAEAEVVAAAVALISGLRRLHTRSHRRHRHRRRRGERRRMKTRTRQRRRETAEAARHHPGCTVFRGRPHRPRKRTLLQAQRSGRSLTRRPGGYLPLRLLLQEWWKREFGGGNRKARRSGPSR